VDAGEEDSTAGVQAESSEVAVGAEESVNGELTVNPKHLPALLAHKRTHMGHQPNVVLTNREHSDYYLSEFCKQPVLKYNPPAHQYLLHASASRGEWARRV
jgi:hypothetical protein